METRDDIRNVAIIAHVDHGKTTLVNELLKQSDTLDSHTEISDRAMDSRSFPKILLSSIRENKSTFWIRPVTPILAVK